MINKGNIHIARRCHRQFDRNSNMYDLAIISTMALMQHVQMLLDLRTHMSTEIYTFQRTMNCDCVMLYNK